jgi:hypothetical protein
MKVPFLSPTNAVLSSRSLLTTISPYCNRRLSSGNPEPHRVQQKHSGNQEMPVSGPWMAS